MEETAKINEEWSDRDQPDPTLAIPLLMQNKIPDGFETDDKLDVSLRPDEAAAADYDAIPIEQFGVALLRGMGWKEGDGIGLRNKNVIPPIEAVLRPKGLGLGADRGALKQLEGNKKTKMIKPGDKREEEEELTYSKGVCGVIQKGPHKDLYGKIEGIDEDNARVMIKLAISGQTVTISQYSLKLVPKKEYDKNSKYLNKGKADRYKEEQMKKESQETNKESNRSRHREKEKERYKERKADKEKDRKRRYEEEKYSEGESKKYKQSDSREKDVFFWLRPQLRVRIIDKRFKSGKYYNCKVEIVDVVTRDTCICKTQEGKLLEDISQSMLETVIPKTEPSYVMIVDGKYRGQLGEIIKKDKEKCRATIQLLSDRDKAVKLDYDIICEYLGDIDAELDY